MQPTNQSQGYAGKHDSHQRNCQPTSPCHTPRLTPIAPLTACKIACSSTSAANAATRMLMATVTAMAKYAEACTACNALDNNSKKQGAQRHLHTCQCARGAGCTQQGNNDKHGHTCIRYWQQIAAAPAPPPPPAPAPGCKKVTGPKIAGTCSHRQQTAVGIQSDDQVAAAHSETASELANSSQNMQLCAVSSSLHVGSGCCNSVIPDGRKPHSEQNCMQLGSQAPVDASQPESSNSQRMMARQPAGVKIWVAACRSIHMSAAYNIQAIAAFIK